MCNFKYILSFACFSLSNHWRLSIEFSHNLFVTKERDMNQPTFAGNCIEAGTHQLVPTLAQGKALTTVRLCCGRQML